MKADAIVAKILEDARAAASRTVSAAEARAAEITKDAEKRSEAARETALAGATREADSLRERMLRMSELDDRKVFLSEKREKIDEAFSAALQKMRKMPRDQARSYAERLVMDAADGDEELIFSAEDEALYDRDFLDTVNRLLLTRGKIGKLTLSASRRETGGGLILKRGGCEVNLTYPVLLSQIRPSLEAEISNLLFQ